MQKPAALIGSSSIFLDAVERASAAAPLNRPVLIIGERGTGKELIAERLHRLSSRWGGPLVSLNCAALPENLIDAELFGYEAGAFTGAQRARAGRFEDADGGTLFLDEIATLAPAAQERLLRVVEYGELTRIGSNRAIHVDVRLVGATNEDLPTLVERGRFRADLLDRLSFEVVTLPPLRERAEDIEALSSHFARRMAAELGWSRFPGFTAAAQTTLDHYAWPGNVRELKNVVERSLYRWGDPDSPIGRIILDPFESPWRPVPLPGGQRAISAAPATTEIARSAPAPLPDCSDFRAAVLAHEREILLGALERCRHNQRRTAAALALSYDQLRHALKRHNMLDQGQTEASSVSLRPQA
ncbi:PSP operon transcriptional activator [Polymorphobacter glacialis]|uniref:PSP operon transcriptional activator n=1 Tax=Sandarakinorhabdus glacialis TaxID=1614636 RepID=A0A916ZTA1_9SPHN|nr:phage shock protein operon transcriptional activator [Polymorphobacter glacialis]GGE11521.1 PSP operon transcriptional activator [Polymorphobacter glacialis]